MNRSMFIEEKYPIANILDIHVGLLGNNLFISKTAFLFLLNPQNLKAQYYSQQFRGSCKCFIASFALNISVQDTFYYLYFLLKLKVCKLMLLYQKRLLMYSSEGY